MALKLFKFTPLPTPPPEYEPQYFQQFIRTLELYFSKLDSLTPQQAQSYTADAFLGGGNTGMSASGVLFPNLTTTEKNALTAVAGCVVFDTTLGKLCVYSGSAWQTITSV